MKYMINEEELVNVTGGYVELIKEGEYAGEYGVFDNNTNKMVAHFKKEVNANIYDTIYHER